MTAPPTHPRVHVVHVDDRGYATFAVRLEGYDDVRFFDRWAADAEVRRAEDAIYERRRAHWARHSEALALQVWHGSIEVPT